MRQNHGAANLLIGVLRIDAETDVQFDRLVELCRRSLLHEFHGLSDTVELSVFQKLRGILVFLAVFCHSKIPLSWS